MILHLFLFCSLCLTHSVSVRYPLWSVERYPRNIFLGLFRVDDVVNVGRDQKHPLFSPLEDDRLVEAFGSAMVHVAARAVEDPAFLGDEDRGAWLGVCVLKCPGVPGEVVLISEAGDGPAEDC